jgi:hypothetical protein
MQLIETIFDLIILIAALSLHSLDWRRQYPANPKGSFLPTAECDMDAVNTLVLRCQIYRSRPPGLSIAPVGTE